VNPLPLLGNQQRGANIKHRQQQQPPPHIAKETNAARSANVHVRVDDRCASCQPKRETAAFFCGRVESRFDGYFFGLC